MNDSLDVADLLASLAGDDAGHEKTAEEATTTPEVEVEETEKLASELRAAGAEMADGFIDQLEKVAADKASSSHAQNGMATGNWGSVVSKLQSMHNIATPGDEGHTRAEKAYSRTIGRMTGKGGPEDY